MNKNYQETLAAAVAGLVAVAKTLEGIVNAAPEEAAAVAVPVRVFTIGEQVTYDGGRGTVDATVVFDPRSSANLGTKAAARAEALRAVLALGTSFSSEGDQVLIIVHEEFGKDEGGAYLSSVRAARREQLS